MAVEVEIPQWVSYAGAGAAAFVGALVVRMGWWSKGGEAAVPEQGRLIGALVDASSVRDLTLAVQSHAEVTKAGFESVETLGNELRNLGDEVRRLANKVENRN